MTLISVDLLTKLAENHLLEVISLILRVATAAGSVIRLGLLLVHLNSLLDLLNQEAHNDPLEITSIGFGWCLVFVAFGFPGDEFLFIFIVALRVILENFSRPLLLEALERSGVMAIGVPRLKGLVGLV